MGDDKKPTFILLIFIFSLAPASAKLDADAPFVGVCIGTDVSDLLSPDDLVRFLGSQRVTHVRLYDADTSLLSALSGTGIRVAVGVPTNQLIAFGSSNDTAVAWVARHLLPFRSIISAVAVGDEVASSDPASLPLLLPAIRSISAAATAANLSSIAISTPLPASLILDPFPPSQAYFNQSLVPSFILPLLRFLANTRSPLMINLYPYYALVQSRGIIPLPNALFKPLPPSLHEIDPNTLLHYTNVLDAMIDAAHFAIRNLNFSSIPLLITETGWPSAGGSDEPQATRNNADTYNSNLIAHVLRRSGTPLIPEATSSAYIYELFNEDLRPGPVSEQNWGLFYGNTTPVYLLQLTGAGGFLENATANMTYCIAADGADVQALQAALDWACGPGKANCSQIQPGELCYLPNNVKAHASYAFNSYYQMQDKAAGSCYFQGSATVTTTDPSHGNCIFTRSNQQNNTTGPITNAAETSKAEVWKIHNLGLELYCIVLSTILTILCGITISSWT